MIFANYRSRGILYITKYQINQIKNKFYFRMVIKHSQVYHSFLKKCRFVIIQF